MLAAYATAESIGDHTTTGFDVLRAYLEAKADFTEGEFSFIRGLVRPLTLRAGEFLQRAGDVSRYAAFVTSGCLRSYVIDAKGKEHIVKFAPETWWLADTNSLMNRTASQFFIDAIEDSNLLLLDMASQQKILAAVPGYAASFQAGVQRHAAARDQRIANTLSASAKERYLEFMKTHPSIALRVPQWMLASYLGMSPETVSRVRKRLARK